MAPLDRLAGVLERPAVPLDRSDRLRVAASTDVGYPRNEGSVLLQQFAPDHARGIGSEPHWRGRGWPRDGTDGAA